MDDVIVVGGGPAGALSAIILARAGVRVRIFERARFPRHKLCGDTLNPGALRVLEQHVPIGPVIARGLALDGMVLTGPGGVAVRGRYGAGLVGRAIARREIDAILLQHAIEAGAQLEDRVAATDPLTDGDLVTGVLVKGARGISLAHRARVVVAADGRESRLARAVGLLRHARRPRRWAIGAYFEDVGGLHAAGEMHVRRGQYIGIAPMPDGLANCCLVVPHESGGRAWRDPAQALLSALRTDTHLAPRFSEARMSEAPRVLGPMAVDATAPGVPGLLLAGDAAGFIDPITGDGLRFALAGAALAAAEALDVLAGRIDPAASVRRLTTRRQQLFGSKWRFNRSLRALVASGLAVTASASAARLLPAAFEAIIRYAGDCDTQAPPLTNR